MKFILQVTNKINKLFSFSKKNLSCSFYKEDGFDSVLIKLSGPIGVSVSSWEGCESAVELRILPEQMDELAKNWLEYRNASGK